MVCGGQLNWISICSLSVATICLLREGAADTRHVLISHIQARGALKLCWDFPMGLCCLACFSRPSPIQPLSSNFLASNLMVLWNENLHWLFCAVFSYNGMQVWKYCQMDDMVFHGFLLFIPEDERLLQKQCMKLVEVFRHYECFFDLLYCIFLLGHLLVTSVM